ncbi:MAG: hypothetical protein K9N46_04980 [Candidatus Marinimicrobia bacterium]|nr:hypothetical protein [Candidatus Neomarinimicrobiota bacterium]MCF7829527.1 hypothetical protein [Candidatus Neomarinimicrobiota bacterium]MCF7880075.1 hypothetical protein [Candidatus Neomarinimicrobiota bacterium]
MNNSELNLPLPARILLLGLGIIGLLTGIWAGLWRAGWMLPVPGAHFPEAHGPLMIAGFLGTLISLERAVALRKAWPFIAPVLAGFGGVLLIVGAVPGLPNLAIAASSGVLSLVFFRLYRKDPELHYIIMGIGANLWLIGNILWLRGFPMPQVVHWWAGFLILTIAGERLELSRVLQPKRRVRQTFIGIVAFYVVALVISVGWFDTGVRLSGVALLSLAAWLFRYDLAMRSVKQRGLSRFMALALIIGYLWLALAGALTIYAGAATAGYLYDAILHATFVGFVFSMIFGHAPVIFPVVLKLQVAYRASFYVHLVLLHLSLILRIGSDLFASDPIRLAGSLLNGVAILLFLYNTITSVLDKKFSG